MQSHESRQFPAWLIFDVRRFSQMLAVLEFLIACIEALVFWRLWLPVAPSTILAILLHHRFEDSSWPWFVSFPLVAVAITVGIYWQWFSRSAPKSHEPDAS